MLLNVDYYPAREMARILHDRAMAGDKMAIDQLLAAVQDQGFDKNSVLGIELLDQASDFITDHALIKRLLQDDDTMTTAIVILENLASKGDDVAARMLDENISRWIENGDNATRAAIIEISGHRLRDPEFLASLLDDDGFIEMCINNELSSGPESIIGIIINTLDTLINEGNEAARRIQEEKLSNLPYFNHPTIAAELLMKWGDKITDSGLLMATLNQSLEKHQNEVDNLFLIEMILKTLASSSNTRAKYALIKGATLCCTKGDEFTSKIGDKYLIIKGDRAIRETGGKYLMRYLEHRGVVFPEHLTMKSYEPYIIDELLADPDPAVAAITRNCIEKWSNRKIRRIISDIDTHVDLLKKSESQDRHECQVRIIKSVIDLLKIRTRHKNWPLWFTNNNLESYLGPSINERKELCRRIMDALLSEHDPRVAFLIEKLKAVMDEES
ncbi:MAG: hypothetical protein Q6373_011470 [Candidatus Sigynarchaeota archaeon]